MIVVSVYYLPHNFNDKQSKFHFVHSLVQLVVGCTSCLLTNLVSLHILHVNVEMHNMWLLKF